MKVTVKMEGCEAVPATVPFPGASWVVVQVDCSACGAKAPLGVFGKNNHVESHDMYAAQAHCKACGQAIGIIRAKVSTIFGIEEDARVLNGRCRVY